MTLTTFFDDELDDAPLPTARAAAQPLAALMEDRFDYPDRIAFLSAESSSFGAAFARAAFDEHRPVLIVMPDGVQFLYEPAPGLLAHLRRLLTARFGSARLRASGPLVGDVDGWVDSEPVSVPGYRRRLRGPQPTPAL